jgi:hypothetical protein
MGTNIGSGMPRLWSKDLRKWVVWRAKETLAIYGDWMN